MPARCRRYACFAEAGRKSRAPRDRARMLGGGSNVSRGTTGTHAKMGSGTIFAFYWLSWVSTSAMEFAPSCNRTGCRCLMGDSAFSTCLSATTSVSTNSWKSKLSCLNSLNPVDFYAVGTHPAHDARHAHEAHNAPRFLCLPSQQYPQKHAFPSSPQPYRKGSIRDRMLALSAVCERCRIEYTIPVTE